MGGPGSGRRSARACTDAMCVLDVRSLRRAGLLTPGHGFTCQWVRGGEPFVTVGIRVEADRVVLEDRGAGAGDGGGREARCYPVSLDWTACRLGGKRPWWRCPVAGCNRRVAVLYGGSLFACRHCHDLAYRSQREGDQARAVRRANRIRHRLGWEPGCLNPGAPKPSRMHWRTFRRLERELEEQVCRVVVGVGERWRSRRR